MRFNELIEKVRELIHPHVAMKAHEFETGADDLGQPEGDVEKQVPPVEPPKAPAERIVH